MKRALVALCVVALVGCSSGANGEQVDYNAFCSKAKELETASQDTHLDDPAAINDTKVMKEQWTTAVNRAVELRDVSPEKVKEDVTLMVSTLIDMDKVFQKYDYNLIEMAKVESIRAELDAISSREGVTDASARFNSFLEKNCELE